MSQIFTCTYIDVYGEALKQNCKNKYNYYIFIFLYNRRKMINTC
ncbi:hypothetical protein KL86DES1_21784 [uncultured Desulfovibrio sp.]|uniref:Uncharacterized protein n=1 Tax=uncultured Desulfovibrio sp. TaxID=167968 RepID=A0A212L9H4_9BACT|nr:hypothetical protein KL86DES1_21784 [uncultured Desulfovibrio sp.]VZH34684.1 conserved protein of unknown function [Desulfovibrio sp. 86]